LADSIARVIDHPQRQRELGIRNYLAARGLSIADVADWYLIHFEELIGRARSVRQPITQTGGVR
jgi:hypothetical protein